MELKNVSINILHPLSISQKIEVLINNADIEKNIKGFHLEINNKVKKSFDCSCYFETPVNLSYSNNPKLLDKKKSLALEFNYHQIKFRVEEFQEQNIYIFLDGIDEDFELETPIYFTKFKTEDDDQKIEIDKLELDIIEQNEEFKKIFGFDKKYHFDQYRYYVLLYLVNDANQEMLSKTLRNAKHERDILLMTDEETFYQEVYKNLLDEEVDKFGDYKSLILQKLKIYVKDLSLLLQKKNSNIISDRSSLFEEREFHLKKRLNLQKGKNIFDKDVDYREINETKLNDNVLKDYKEIFEVERKQNLKNIFGVNFKCSILQRKGFYFQPHFSLIIFKDGDYQQTIENFLKTKINFSFEILIFTDDEVDEGIFKTYDLLFSIKNVSPFLKIGKHLQLSPIQKIIIMTNFIKNINNSFFIIPCNSILPENYIEKSLKNKNEDKITCASYTDLYHPQTGLIIQYEINKNYPSLSECLFPMFYLKTFSKFNFTSPLFGQMKRLKDLRNFMLKNNSIIGIDYIKTHNGLNIFEV